MTSDLVPLQFASGSALLRVRELTGTDERSVSGVTTADAIALLDKLLREPSSKEPMTSAEDLVAADRDRLLVAIYRRAFGDRIENTVNCTRCATPFDLNFLLSHLVETLDQRTKPSVKRVDDHRFETSEGLRFRLPNGRDEQTLAAEPSADAEGALLRCCLEGQTEAIDAAAFQELLADMAPLVDLELTGRCPECGREHALQFDIQTYLLHALIGEQERLALEIHRLAVAYGWSLAEILSLARTERRYFVSLIDTESSRSRRSSS